MNRSRNLTHHRRVVLAMTNTLLGVMVAFVAIFIAASSSTAIVDSEIGHRPVAPSVQWSPKLAKMFPGCHKSLPEGQIPSAVIEVRGGFPVRVGFDDAWKRTHDSDDSNNGDVIGQCR